MSALLGGLLTFCLLVVAHLVVSRTWKPSAQYTAVTALALLAPLLSLEGMLVLWLLVPEALRFLPANPVDYVTAATLYAALVVSYITTYSAVQADSPTMTILLKIDRAGPTGLPLERLPVGLDDRVLVVPRVNDLVTGGLVRRRGDRYVIGRPGVAMARVHLLYRGLLRMEKGG